MKESNLAGLLAQLMVTVDGLNDVLAATAKGDGDRFGKLTGFRAATDALLSVWDRVAMHEGWDDLVFDSRPFMIREEESDERAEGQPLAAPDEDAANPA